MVERATEIKVGIVAVLAGFTAIWGWVGWLFILFVFLSVVDVITGCVASGVNGGWESVKMGAGIVGKVGNFIVAVLSGLMDLAIGQVLPAIITLPFEYTTAIFPVVVAWYCVKEFGSIIENAINMGADMPDWLRSIMAVCETGIDSVGEKVSTALKGGKDIDS